MQGILSEMKATCSLQTSPDVKSKLTAENEDLVLKNLSNGLGSKGDDAEEQHTTTELVESKNETTAVVSAAPNDITQEPAKEKVEAPSNAEGLSMNEEGWATAAKDRAVARLGEQLTAARHELKLRDEEVARLSRIRTEVEAELEELTASLFQEAHNMVRQANVAKAQAERNLNESQMKVEVLQAEVAALKTLVLTSTPSRPNTHLHPQLESSASASAMNLFTRSHRRSPSHFNLKYGRENSPPDSPVKEKNPAPAQSEQREQGSRDDLEVDPVVHKEFLAWRQAVCMDRSDPFIDRVYREDIDLCLDFCNKDLETRVYKAVEAGTLFIECVTDKSRSAFPKKCGLMDVQRLCHYRMRLGDQDQWHHICQVCRNRVTAVCDFLNYLQYIQRGLVKSSVPDVYWEIARLRKEMALARLGLPLSS